MFAGVFNANLLCAIIGTVIPKQYLVFEWCFLHQDSLETIPDVIFMIVCLNTYRNIGVSVLRRIWILLNRDFLIFLYNILHNGRMEY